MLDETLSGFVAMSAWEYVAVLFSIIYVILAIRENSWCWPAAFVSTSIYTLLFWQGALLMESLLNFYYLLMAIYGFFQWQKVAKTDLASQSGGNNSQQRPIVRWSSRLHLKIVLGLAICSMIIGFLLDNYTHAKLPYLDTFTTVYALFATYLLTQKVLENWLYWVVIDLASIYLYVEQGYYPTAILFVLYSGLAIQGFLQWRRGFEQPTADQLSSGQ